MELEKRFTQVLNLMDLPPDKARLLKQYDDDKKWELIRDQERMVAKDPPSFYLDKLVLFMDPKTAYKFLKKKKNQGTITSTQVLRNLEISLRTNNIEWVREFLNEQNNGLDVLIKYLGLANFEMQRIIMVQKQNEQCSSKYDNSETSPSSTATYNGGDNLNSQYNYYQKNGNHLHNHNHLIYSHNDLDTNHTSSPDSTDVSYASSSDKSSMRRKKGHSTAVVNGVAIRGDNKSNGTSKSNGTTGGSSNGHVQQSRLQNTHEEEGAGDNKLAGRDVPHVPHYSVSPINTILSSILNLTTGAAANFTSSFGVGPLGQSAASSFLAASDNPATDVHICIMCLRALMNNKYGFNQVISHKDAINYVALGLMHKNYRTKAQVLELLAAVCLFKGGHDIILAAFDYFREVSREKERFQTLMHYFRNYTGEFNVDFMVACMQFINIVVHSVENMNYRVALQYAFTKIGLDEYLQKLRHTESEQLQVQISAYLDNVCNVGLLMQEAEMKNTVLEQVADLQEQIESMNDKLVETENQAMARIVEMQTYIENISHEKEEIKKLYERADIEACTLKKNYSDKESDFIQKQKELDQIMNEYLYLKEQFTVMQGIQQHMGVTGGVPVNNPILQTTLTHSPSFPAAPSATVTTCNSNFDTASFDTHIPPPPPPPPLPFSHQLSRPLLPASSNALSTFLSKSSATNSETGGNLQQLHHGYHHNPAIPNIPPLHSETTANAMNETVAIKRRIETKYRLPLLNWIPLKPRQLKGTIFNEIDDESLLNVIDFVTFEELFKLGPQRNNDLGNNGPTQNNLHNISTATPLLNGKDGAFDGETFPDGSLFCTNSLKNNTAINGFYGKSAAKAKEFNTLLESTRIRNLAITRRRLDMEDNEIARAINNLDLKILDLETVDILIRMLPTEIEKRAFKAYESEGKQVTKLTPEDRFLHQLCKIERLHIKLSIMSFMGNFAETVHLVTPQIHSLIVASKSIRNSEKLKKIFEIILVFGNYLNSSRKGGVYGFKVQSLDTLSILKAPGNKEMSLLHFIVQTIMNNFPHLLNFDNELNYIEKAVDVSLENIQTDVHELVKGMEDTLKEYNARKGNPIHSLSNSKETLLVLEEFLSSSQDKLTKVKSEAKTSEDSYTEVVEFLGESSKALPPNSFFPLFVRFIRQFKQAQIEIETKLENYKLRENQNNLSSNHKSKINRNRKSDQNSSNNNGMLSELRKKQDIKGNTTPLKMLIGESSHLDQNSQSSIYGHYGTNNSSAYNLMNESGTSSTLSKVPQLISQEEIYHGALEDILTDLKKEPFRATENIPRKSGIFAAR